MRRDYTGVPLRRADLPDSPLDQFDLWLQEALDGEVDDPNAMSLATVGESGPSIRIVLLKQYDAAGFCWYTDQRSLKGRQLAQNPRAALLFFWRRSMRQVRLCGAVEQLPCEDAERYFHSRPQGSRFSAAASHQSAVIQSRRELEMHVSDLQARYPTGDVPRPNDWRGYRLQPDAFEFWQGQSDRLHDRFVYRQVAKSQSWSIDRLAP